MPCQLGLPEAENITTHLDGTTRGLLAGPLLYHRLDVYVGADISLNSPGPFEKRAPNTFMVFSAANGSSISTYGQKSLTLDLGLRRQFRWVFNITTVTHPIVGADFLGHFSLLIDLKNKRLIDTLTNLKFAFQVPEFEFLGHTVSDAGLRPTDIKVKEIREFPEEKSINQLRRFLNIVTFYRRFLPHTDQTLLPLTNLLRGSSKKLIMTAAGAVLQRTVNGVVQPLAYFSVKFNEAQKRYITFGRELLATYLAAKHFRYLLGGRQFTINTNHKPLAFANRWGSNLLSSGESRNLDYILQFSTDIRHVKGEDNAVADALSSSHIDAVNTSTHVDFEDIAIAHPSMMKLSECSDEKKRLSPSTTMEIRHPLFHSMSSAAQILKSLLISTNDYPELSSHLDLHVSTFMTRTSEL
ncbi:unnamed protein product [Mesocestoides corti]|uniref:RT_RNaseH domain-containing protein n=1 Tax=Mesocestoides corti TaxID=53468 RepID=A0A0R3ULL4_MESCO|nr:unnamed protein product [Mesocestoides corti]